MKNLLTVAFAACALCAFAEGEYVLNSSGIGQTYDWDEPDNWVGGEVPPADGTATVVISNCLDQVDKNDRNTIRFASPVNVYKLIVHEGKVSTWTDAISHGPLLTAVTDEAKLTIGAGGLEIASFEAPGFAANAQFGGAPSFDVPIHLSATQLWKVNCHSTTTTAMKKRSMYFTRDISSAENVVWTLAGNANATFQSGSSAGFSGKVVFNVPVMYFLTNGQATRFDHCTVRYEYGDLDGNGVNTSVNVTYFGQSSGEWEVSGTTEWASSAGYILRICDNWTKTNTIAVRFTGPVSGSLTGEGQIQQGCISGTSALTSFTDTWMSHDGQRYMFVFDWQNDASTLTTKGLMTYADVVLSKTTSFQGWAQTYSFRGYGNFAHAVGYYLRNGVTSSATFNHTWSSGVGIGGVGIDYMGIDEPGVATFSSTVTAWGEGIVNAPVPVATAAKGGATVFSGTIQGGYGNYAPYKPFNRFEVCGEGEVVFKGSWSTGIGHYEQGPLIRGGTAVVAKGGAIGPDFVELGVTVPRVLKVKGYSTMDMNAWKSWRDYGEGGANAWNTSLSDVAAMFGSHVKPGDLVLLNQAASHAQYNGVFRILSNGRLQRDTITKSEDVRANLRVEITDGPKAGAAYYVFHRHDDPYYTNFWARVKQPDGTYTHEYRNVLSGTGMNSFTLDSTALAFARESKADPDCALRIGDGLDYTNSIIVNANLSCGESSIGGWSNAVSCTVSGPIEMYRDISLASDRAGSVTTFSGTFTDHTAAGARVTVSAVGTADVTGATFAGDQDRTFGLKRGTLKVTPQQLADAARLVWQNNGAGLESGTGCLLVDGDLDVSGLASVMTMEGFEKKLEADLDLGVIIAATGNLTGTIGRPSGLPATWSIEKTDAGIVLSYTRPGAVILVR